MDLTHLMMTILAIMIYKFDNRWNCISTSAFFPLDHGKARIFRYWQFSILVTGYLFHKKKSLLFSATYSIWIRKSIFNIFPYLNFKIQSILFSSFANTIENECEKSKDFYFISNFLLFPILFNGRKIGNFWFIFV